MKPNQLQLPVKALLLILVLGMYGCSVNNEIDDSALNEASITISNDETKLNERLKEMDFEILVESDTTNANKRMKKKSFSLKLMATIETPTVEGVKTMATMVHVFDNSSRAAVSYNLKGANYKGGIDFLQLRGNGNNPISVRSSVEFANAKANAVYIGDDNIFVAHSSNDPALTQNEGFSAIQMFEYSGFNINRNVDRAGLPGFAANSVHESGNIVYVTSGDNAGLSAFDFSDEDLSNKIGYLDIPDARWIDSDEKRIVVLASNPGSGIGTLYVLDVDDRTILNQFTFEGADTPEAKNTVEIKGDLALIAAGRSGTHLMDLNTGELIANIPIPDPSSLDLSPEVVETNAATADEEFIFIANGEAGVYVAVASSDLNNYVSGGDLSIELLGFLKFDDLQSANHVSYRNKMLVVAAGLGGVKAVRLDRK